MSSDTSIATAGIKACCACGTDVAGQPRMKDSHGRYWCMPCGEADQRRKAITSTTAHCAGCHKEFSKGKLDKHGEHWFCKACLKKRTKAEGTRVAPAAAAATAAGGSSAPSPSHAGAAVMSGGDPGDRRRILLLAAVLVVLVLISLLFNFVWSG